ncbi:MAG: putative Death-on-curing family protein [Candidatus Moranbacteria bacterium GW2011_GWA2_39_41]|nr:MAG: putative Death-on-curing family protein [Candidatus Moranbacteria bacterium GW2011_GWA2_39_41]
MVKKQKEAPKQGEIIIYKDKRGEIELEVSVGKETIWLTQKQVADLFGVNIPAVSKHINNIYEEKELVKKATVSKMETVQIEGGRHIKRNIEFFNLDVIIAVGYRVNSKRATEFRIWATNVLKDHLLKGYTVNQKRLLQERENFEKLQKTIAFLREKAHAKTLQGQESEFLDLLGDYARTLTFLEQYDKSKLKVARAGKAKFVLKYEVCQNIVAEIKKELMTKKEASDIFGTQRGGAFESVIKNLYQTFGGKELYANLETKAAHLLYLVIKDHPFSDGNKRIGAFLFVYFLDKNRYLYDVKGEKKINDNALTALALLVAESNPKEKDVIIALITNLLNK